MPSSFSFSRIFFSISCRLTRRFCFFKHWSRYRLSRSFLGSELQLPEVGRLLSSLRKVPLEGNWVSIEVLLFLAFNQPVNPSPLLDYEAFI